uniref:Uncharacterized protein n=1 Tax=Schistosoma mansoni TaxID=6183 RepID=A0A5K4F8N4_SCHMA
MVKIGFKLFEGFTSINFIVSFPSDLEMDQIQRIKNTLYCIYPTDFTMNIQVNKKLSSIISYPKRNGIFCKCSVEELE